MEFIIYFIFIVLIILVRPTVRKIYDITMRLIEDKKIKKIIRYPLILILFVLLNVLTIIFIGVGIYCLTVGEIVIYSTSIYRLTVGKEILKYFGIFSILIGVVNFIVVLLRIKKKFSYDDYNIFDLIADIFNN